MLMEADAGAWEVWGALRADRLDDYEKQREAEQVAGRALEALQCGVTFDVEDGDGEDEWTYPDRCRLPAGHDGAHDIRLSDSSDAPAPYRDAVSTYRAAMERAADAHELWDEADEALDALQCHYQHPTEAVWPCVLWRGHDGAHEHPTAMRLV